MSFNQRLHEVRTGFERPFWVANITELFERLSYYAAFASLARYLHETLAFPWSGFSPSSAAPSPIAWVFVALFPSLISFWQDPISSSALSVPRGSPRSAMQFLWSCLLLWS